VVNAIELDVGDLAGIELDSLQFCFHSARKGTMADQAELVVNQIPALGHCPECGRDVPLEFPLGACPECGQAVVEAFQGRELRVKSINVD
jgi:hydrogenase nickel incorporation protein HypA/HybF